MRTSLRLLVASTIDAEAVEALRRGHDVRMAVGASESALVESVHDRDVIIFRSGVEISRDVLANAPNLRLLVRAGSGLDNLDLDYVKQRGIVLHRIPGPGARAVAELAFALMLNLARQVRTADQSMREGRWLKSSLTGHLLEGKTLGVIGLGNIGSTVARLGVRLGMTVIGCVERPTPVRAAAFAADGIGLAECDAVLAAADFIVIQVPLSQATRCLIGARELGLVKPTAFLLNMARGGIVDESALRAALVEGRLAGAALDTHVVEGEGALSGLADLPNVLLTPHIGASTVDTQREIGREIVRFIDAFERDSTEVPADVSAVAGVEYAS